MPKTSLSPLEQIEQIKEKESLIQKEKKGATSLIGFNYYQKTFVY